MSSDFDKALELTVCENLEAARRLHPGAPSQAVGRVIERLGLEGAAARSGIVVAG